MTSHPLNWRLAAPGSLLLVLAIAACASPPPPTSELSHARSAITRAQLDGAEQLAPRDLSMAQEKYSKAQTAMSSPETYTQAKYMAEQAEVDANYADATSVAQRAQTTATELEEAKPSLHTGPQPPSRPLPSQPQPR